MTVLSIGQKMLDFINNIGRNLLIDSVRNINKNQSCQEFFNSIFAQKFLPFHDLLKLIENFSIKRIQELLL